MDQGAIFSECRAYRYELWRIWDEGREPVIFIGLNPSTADEQTNDPTVRRCIGYAQDWGGGGLVMLNAYAYRATDPQVMKSALDPIGKQNDYYLQSYVGRGIIVAAWGVHCHPLRQQEICRMIPDLQCLGVTKFGFPKHPLYLRRDAQLQPFLGESHYQQKTRT